MIVNPTLENHNPVLWRFMDFTKFADLIITNKLYLNRMDCFEDTYEGYLSGFMKDSIRKSYNDLGIPVKKDIYENRIENQKNIRYYAYANCWHKNDYESAAMWKLYASSNESIAIKINLNCLKESLILDNNMIENGNVFLDSVNYIDYSKLETYPDNLFKNWKNLLFTKRMSFIHENEVRIMYLMNKGLATLGNTDIAKENIGKSSDLLKKMNPYGIYLDVNLKKLIKEIYVSPNAPEWFYQMTKKFLIKVGLSEVVCEKSELYDLK